MNLSDMLPGLKKKIQANQEVDADNAALRDAAVKSARRRELAAYGLTFVAVTGLIAVAMNKQPPITHVVRVGETSGSMDFLPAWDGDISTLGNKTARAMTEQVLTQYLRACESYYWGNVNADQIECAALSSDKVNKERALLWDRNNPESPLVKYEDGTTVRPSLISMIPIDADDPIPTQWRIRFTQWLRPRGSTEEKASTWEATAVTATGRVPRDAKYRVYNRLGFIIAEWRVYPEVKQNAPVPAAAARQVSTQ